ALLGGRAGRGGRRARGRGRSGDPLREIRVEVVHLAGFGDDLVPTRRGPDLAETAVRVVAMLGGDRTVVQVGAEVVAFRRVDAAGVRQVDGGTVNHGGGEELLDGGDLDAGGGHRHVRQPSRTYGPGPQRTVPPCRWRSSCNATRTVRPSSTSPAT